MRAINIRMTDLGYPAGTEDALASYETHAAILAAIETLTDANLLDGETSPAYQLWQDDPEGYVAAYLAAQYSAEDGDTLPWGAGCLTWHADTQEWIAMRVSLYAGGSIRDDERRANEWANAACNRPLDVRTLLPAPHMH